MLHYVHQLVVNCVCLPFGPEQVVYSWFLKLFLWKQLPAAAKNQAIRAVRVNQNSKVVGWQLNIELKLTIKLHKAVGSCWFRWWVPHYERPLSHCHTVFTLPYIVIAEYIIYIAVKMLQVHVFTCIATAAWLLILNTGWMLCSSALLVDAANA